MEIETQDLKINTIDDFAYISDLPLICDHSLWEYCQAREIYFLIIDSSLIKLWRWNLSGLQLSDKNQNYALVIVLDDKYLPDILKTEAQQQRNSTIHDDDDNLKLGSQSSQEDTTVGSYFHKFNEKKTFSLYDGHDWRYTDIPNTQKYVLYVEDRKLPNHDTNDVNINDNATIFDSTKISEIENYTSLYSNHIQLYLDKLNSNLMPFKFRPSFSQLQSSHTLILNSQKIKNALGQLPRLICLPTGQLFQSYPTVTFRGLMNVWQTFIFHTHVSSRIPSEKYDRFLDMEFNIDMLDDIDQWHRLLVLFMQIINDEEKKMSKSKIGPYVILISISMKEFTGNNLYWNFLRYSAFYVKVFKFLSIYDKNKSIALYWSIDNNPNRRNSMSDKKILQSVICQLRKMMVKNFILSSDYDQRYMFDEKQNLLIKRRIDNYINNVDHILINGRMTRKTSVGLFDALIKQKNKRNKYENKTNLLFPILKIV